MKIEDKIEFINWIAKHPSVFSRAEKFQPYRSTIKVADMRALYESYEGTDLKFKELICLTMHEPCKVISMKSKSHRVNIFKTEAELKAEHRGESNARRI